MQYLTLIEQANLVQNSLRRGFIEIFPRTSPVLERLPFMTIAGNAYTYNIEKTMPGIAFRGINETYTPDTGVINPVTAVLLNFRAYDTLLELAVLSAALLGVLVLGPGRSAPRIAGPVVTNQVAWLAPLLIVTAGYLLWVGAHAPGGAFQAGALLAAAGIIVRLSGSPNFGLPSGVWLRLIAVAGCGVFLFVGLASMGDDASLLQYPADWAGTLILLIEVFATLSIATSLLLVYLGGQPDAWAPGRERDHA